MQTVSWVAGSAKKSKERAKSHEPLSKNSKAETPANYHATYEKEENMTQNRLINTWKMSMENY